MPIIMSLPLCATHYLVFSYRNSSPQNFLATRLIAYESNSLHEQRCDLFTRTSSDTCFIIKAHGTGEVYERVGIKCVNKNLPPSSVKISQ